MNRDYNTEESCHELLEFTEGKRTIKRTFVRYTVYVFFFNYLRGVFIFLYINFIEWVCVMY